MNAWLKYLSGGGGSLREGAEGVGQEVVEGGRKVEGELVRVLSENQPA